jgi:hypothetical protein
VNFISSHTAGSSVGRQFGFLVRDRVTKKYLGILCIANDYLDVPPRDKAIGWTRQDRHEHSMLEHTAVGSTIVPTQPFGRAFLGGKLLSLLLLSNQITDLWQAVYGKRLVGITTTSLFGAKSLTQYDNLKYWKNVGKTNSKGIVRPTKEVSKMMREWLLYNEPRIFWDHFRAKRRNGQPIITNATNKAYSNCYRALGISARDIASNHDRGVYFARLYSNTEQFLQRKISEDRLSRPIDNSTESLTAIWRDKLVPYYFKKNKPDEFSVSFYDELFSLTWDETKERFLDQVGR